MGLFKTLTLTVVPSQNLWCNFLIAKWSLKQSQFKVKKTFIICHTTAGNSISNLANVTGANITPKGVFTGCSGMARFHSKGTLIDVLTRQTVSIKTASTFADEGTLCVGAVALWATVGHSKLTLIDVC